MYELIYIYHMKKRCFHIFLLSFHLISNILFGQAPLFKSFSYNEGLNTYNIYKTVQDRYGFIWIATQDGIYRYNGNSFEALRNAIDQTGTDYTNHSFNLNVDINVNTDGKIYTAYYNQGIGLVDPASLQVKNLLPEIDLSAQNSLPNLWVKKVFIDKNQNLWVGGRAFIAYMPNGSNQFTAIKRIPGFDEELQVLYIYAINPEYIAVVVSNYGVLLFNVNTFKLENTLRCSKNKRFAGIKDIITDKDTLFAITDNRIFQGKLTGAKCKWLNDYTFSKPDSLIVNCMVRDAQRNFWIGTNMGLMKISADYKKTDRFSVGVSKTRWLEDNNINHLMIDTEENLWISTSKMLQMMSLKANIFRYFSGDKTGSDHMDHVYSLVQKNETEIFATGTDGLYITNLTSALTKKVPGSSSLGLVHYVEKIDEDFWIICCDLGMYGYIPSKEVLSKDALLSRFPEWTKYQKRYFNNCYRKGNISYWASEEQEGLFKWDMNKHEITQFKNGTAISGGLSDNHLHNIKIDRDGFLWLLTDNTLEKFDLLKDSVVTVLHDSRKVKDFSASIFFDMYDDGNRFWVGCYGGGLCSYHKKDGKWERFSEKDGLCNNTIYGILPEGDSVLWLSTNMGISRYNHKSGACYNYYYDDGLQDNSFDEKGYLQANNKLYFGGINGFTEIDPGKFNVPSSALPVYIYKMEYYRNAHKHTLYNLAWDKLDLPTGTNTVILHLAALNFSNNHNIRFSYKIENLQNDFRDVDKNNTITLNALSYGNYNIIIRFRKSDGNFVENALQFKFRIFPEWYQTWWSRLMIYLVIGSMIYTLYRYRIIQIKKQHEIRRNIATDLHDDLGSTLHSVKIFTNLAINNINRNESLYQIKSNLNEATHGLRDMIWLLDDSLNTVDALITRLKQFALPVAAAGNIAVNVQENNDVRRRHLSKEEKRNIFLICKEAINNSIKYSEASQINIIVVPDGKKIIITITDNGKGFDITSVNKGYGLSNMQYRANQIRYKTNIFSTPGKGTLVEIRPV